MVEFSKETLEELHARQRKEMREFNSKVTGLKKSVGKGAADKQKRKQVMDDIQRMEQEIQDRHKLELSILEAADTPVVVLKAPEPVQADAAVETITDNLATTDITAEEPAQRKGKKKNKAKARLEKRQAQWDAAHAAAGQEAALMVDNRAAETQEIKRTIEPLGLEIMEIRPDGHCLYNAIAHQLEIHGCEPLPYKELRGIAADYIRSHKDDFLPFLVDEHGEMVSEDGFDAYCDRVQSEAVWAGQLEIQALSQALKKQIRIVQAGDSVLTIGDEFDPGNPLIVSYHRHYFGLGEHYNSLVPTMKQ